MEQKINNSFQIPHYILNDLCTRFIINIPDAESQDIIRVFFQIELAHWFYLDFYCPDNPQLHQCSLKEFSFQMFVFCPTLSGYVNDFDSIFESWKEYKQAVPTYGAILLDPTLQYCLLVQGYWVKASWGFPKGKVNQDEKPVECAVREVLEETGFDTRNLINENEYLEHRINEQMSRLYIISGVSKETHFQAKTRQEIKSFGWYRVDYLPTHKKDNICKQQYNLSPNSFFMVIPFVKELKTRINQMLSRQQQQQQTIGISDLSAASSSQRSNKTPAKSSSDLRPTSEKKRLKQQQQLMFPLDHSHPAAASEMMFVSPYLPAAYPPKSFSPRQTKWSSQPNKPVSPMKQPTQKQLKILNRDGTLSGQKINTELVGTAAFGSQKESNGKTNEEDEMNDFSCPFWKNFKLDIDQVMAAMML